MLIKNDQKRKIYKMAPEWSTLEKSTQRGKSTRRDRSSLAAVETRISRTGADVRREFCSSRCEGPPHVGSFGEDTMTVQATAPSDHHPTTWYSDMGAEEKNTFWACIGGWMLDAMDVQMFSFAIPAIIASFQITNADVGLIGTATLLSSAFGGWFAGALSDRFGRVRTLQITIAWFAVFTFLCGFAQNYTQLFAFRALMGFGFGGEWAAAAVLIGEVIRAEHRGKAVGAMQSGWAIGWAIAALLATWFFSVLPAERAWRALFWVGLAPALLVFFIRRFVDEPAVFAQTRQN